MVMLCCQFKTIFNIAKKNRFYIKTVSCQISFSTLKVFELVWRKARAKPTVPFLLISARKKYAASHETLHNQSHW